MGTVYCGNHMAINGVSTARRFTIEKINKPTVYVASNTLLGSGAIKGAFDWKGVYYAYGAQPAFMPTAAFTFSGTADTGAGLDGEAIIERVRILGPLEDSGIVQHEVYFAGNGELTTGAGGDTDATVPDPPPAVDTSVAWAAELTNVRQWRLEFFTNLKEYVTSSTLGWVNRLKGAIMGKLEVDLYSVGSDGPTIGTDAVCTITVAAGPPAETYVITWMHATGYRDLDVNHEGRNAIGATLLGTFNGFSAGVAGSIVLPDASTWWPAP